MNNPRNLFREFNDEKLEQVRTHPYFSKIREYILTQADEMIVTDPPRIKYSDLHAYSTTGSRDPYNIAFEPYRARMNMLFQAYLVTGDEKYLPELADTVWNKVYAHTVFEHIRFPVGRYYEDTAILLQTLEAASVPGQRVDGILAFSISVCDELFGFFMHRFVSCQRFIIHTLDRRTG